MLKRLLLAIFLTSLLSSCGFKVIYRQQDDGTSAYVNELSSIRIKKDRKRLSQELKNNLYDLFNPEMIESEPKYFLVLNTARSIGSTFTTATGASGRNQVIINVNYDLKNINTGETISSGSTTVNDNYDVTTNRYGTYTAEKYIENNLAIIAAQNIRNSIINDFIEAKEECEENKDDPYYECSLDMKEEIDEESGKPKEPWIDRKDEKTKEN